MRIAMKRLSFPFSDHSMAKNGSGILLAPSQTYSSFGMYNSSIKCTETTT